MSTERTERRKRGLASASKEDRLRVAVLGGNAHHEVRGLQGADQATRTAVAKLGGFARAAARRARLMQSDNEEDTRSLELNAVHQPRE